MRALIIIVILLFSTPAFAGDWFTWDDDNTKLHVPLTLLFVADMSQTIYIAESPDYYEKWNGILGENPSKEEVYTYFATSYVIVTGLTYILPEKWSHALQGGAITIEAAAVNNNVHLGIGFSF